MAAKPRRGRPKGAANRSATFRLPVELLEELARQAHDQERSLTTLVKRALESYLKENPEAGGGGAKR
jgi:predicted HicB family RNase H-like nuclease